VAVVITGADQQRFEVLRDGVALGAITVTIRGDGRARVAFEFPREIEIWRGEVVERMQRDGRKPKGQNA
jgi:sRNA-binding carbon storage regulator CsrA